MRHLDLFSGIGGFALAAEWCWGEEYEPVAFCEIDENCRSELNKQWPGVPIWRDVRRPQAVSHIDLLTAGPPCQPISHAAGSRRKGRKDSRFLWEPTIKIIAETNPRWVLLENPVGIHQMDGVLPQILSQMAGLGFELPRSIDGLPIVLDIPAGGVGALHERQRTWILANASGQRLAELWQSILDQNGNNSQPTIRWPFVSTWLEMGNEIRRWDSVNGSNPKTLDGVSAKALGNAIVPQVAYEIFRAIKQVDHANPRLRR